MHTSVDALIQLVCERFGVDPADVRGRYRGRTVVWARHIAMWLCRESLGYSYPEIGRTFGRDHASVISAIRRVNRKAESSPSLMEWLSDQARSAEWAGGA
jgi:chromosomal replication initiator protein